MAILVMVVGVEELVWEPENPRMSQVWRAETRGLWHERSDRLRECAARGVSGGARADAACLDAVANPTCSLQSSGADSQHCGIQLICTNGMKCSHYDAFFTLIY